MNKKGGVFFGVMIGIFLYIMGVLFIPFIVDDIDTTRDDLDCSNASAISDGTKMTCLQVDLVLPYLIWFFVSLAVGYISGAST